MESKEEKILQLFFENPTKEWHFEEILKEAKIGRSKAYGWLIKFIKEGLIKRIKTNGKMPYYLSNHDMPAYRNMKKIFALNALYQTGLLNDLCSLNKAKTVILFGSFARSDWHSGSDIDLFLLGKADNFQQAVYEKKTGREIQTFIYKDSSKIEKGLLKSISTGYIIKGSLNA